MRDRRRRGTGGRPLVRGLAGIALAAILSPAVPSRAQDADVPGVIEKAAADAAYAYGGDYAPQLRTIAEWSGIGDVFNNVADAWVVADDVLARHSYEAAVGLAAVTPAAHDPGALRDYLAARRTEPDRAAARAVIARAETDLDRHQGAAPLQALEAQLRATDVKEGTVLALRRSLALSRIAAHRRRFGEAGDLAEPMADEARRLGWTWGARAFLTRAARLAWRAQRWDVAIRRYDRAVRELPETATPLQRAGLLNDLAVAMIEAGEYDGAHLALEEAWRAYGDASPDRFRTEANQAELACRRRRYVDALSHVRHAEAGLEAAIREAKAGGPEREPEAAGWTTDLAFAWTVHARLLDYLGRWEDSLALYRRALAVHAAGTAIDEREAEAVCLGNIALVLDEMGKHDEARPNEARALDLFEKVLADPRRVAEILTIRAARARRLARAEEAREASKAAAKLARSLGEDGVLAEALLEEARAAVALAQHADAEAALREVLRITETRQDPLLRAEVLEVSARGRLLAGDVPGAIDQARAGTVVLGSALSGFEDEMAARVRGAHLGLYEVGALACVRSGRLEDLAAFLDGGRGRTLVRALGGTRSLAGLAVPPDLAAERDAAAREVARASRALDEVLRTAGPDVRPPELAARRRDLDAAQRRLADVEGDVRARQSGYSSRAASAGVSMEALRKALAPGKDRGTTLVVYGLLGTDAIALVVRPEGEEERLVTLPQGAEAVGRLCEALVDEASLLPWGDRVAAARAALIDPLELGKETKRLLVCPDGPLAYAPFRALLPDSIAVSLVPSASTWVSLLPEGRRRGEGVLALGGCDYDTRYEAVALAMEVHGRGIASPVPAAVGPRRSGFPRLAESEGEARAIGTDVLVGPAASVPSLRQRLARTRTARLRAVHLACHGSVDEEHPSLSALVLTATEKDDGFLKVHDIVGLDLSTDLVTLSACSTARGPDLRGEGLFSVARAFMAAGAPRVVATLWKVDDPPAAAFMKRFYVLYREGVPASEALRRTQVEMRDGKVTDGEGRVPPTFRSPKAWAAWVLWGVAD